MGYQIIERIDKIKFMSLKTGLILVGSLYKPDGWPFICAEITTLSEREEQWKSFPKGVFRTLFLVFENKEEAFEYISAVLDLMKEEGKQHYISPTEQELRLFAVEKGLMKESVNLNFMSNIPIEIINIGSSSETDITEVEFSCFNIRTRKVESKMLEYKKMDSKDASFLFPALPTQKLTEMDKIRIVEFISSNEKSFVNGGLSLWKDCIQPNDWRTFQKDFEDIFQCLMEVDDENEIFNIEDIVYVILDKFKHGMLIFSRILEILLDIFGLKLKYLTNIEIYGSRRSLEIPPILGRLVFLEVLVLEDCGLKTLPEELWALKNLKILDLNCNELTKISWKLGKLTQLRVLRVYQNSLWWLPEEIGQLQELRSLDLHDNWELILPDEIGDLINLEELYLSGSSISSVRLPDFVYRLKNLKTLEFDFCVEYEPERLPSGVK